MWDWPRAWYQFQHLRSRWFLLCSQLQLAMTSLSLQHFTWVEHLCISYVSSLSFCLEYYIVLLFCQLYNNCALAPLFICCICASFVFFLPTGAWETNSSACREDPDVPLQRGQVPVGATQVMLDLPGMVTEGKRDDGPFYHNIHFDQCKNSTAGQMTTTSPHISGGVNLTKST